MKEISLGKIKSHLFGDYLTLAISKEFLDANGGKPLEFEAKLTEKGRLVLSAPVQGLSDRTKDVDSNVM